MKKLLCGLMAVLMGGMLMTPMMMEPVYAECPDGCVPTSILGNATGSDGEKCSCDDGSGSEIMRILNLIVSIMTIGVGILGVVGITIVGIQYLTAGGSEEKTRKAKQRLFEIVIGLVVYVLIYALLSWLVPDFHPF
ncbi:hypothetical protein IJH01_02860 [Candidatus Saccharibacteria bacterium]|nr:hypothetical protein [Candidatus Saccharibacteria bacterium]